MKIALADTKIDKLTKEIFKQAMFLSIIDRKYRQKLLQKKSKRNLLQNSSIIR